MSRAFLLFPSMRHAIKAEAYCREKGVNCKVVPVPRQISSECGMSLEIDIAVADHVFSQLHDAGFPVSVSRILS